MSFRMQRRNVLALGGAMTATALVGRASAAGGPQELALWPSMPPGTMPSPGPEKVSGKGSITKVTHPRLRVYRPSRPNGTAMLIIAGGGYAHIEAGNESTPASQWLQSQGITAFELIYRMPEDGWAHDAPFQDGQRALRIIRAGAAKDGLHGDRIGVLGFSAGGHLAAVLETTPQVARYAPQDDIDKASARPDFAGLIYPVITFMPPLDHTHSRREIVGEHPSEAESAAFSAEKLVDGYAPPTFLAQATDDPISAIANSRMMFAALQAAHVPSELHVFPSGGHGWGMGRPGTETTQWPALFTAWATRLGMFGPPQG